MTDAILMSDHASTALLSRARIAVGHRIIVGDVDREAVDRWVDDGGAAGGSRDAVRSLESAT